MPLNTKITQPHNFLGTGDTTMLLVDVKNHIIDFGKYKGMTAQTLVESHNHYCVWMMSQGKSNKPAFNKLLMFINILMPMWDEESQAWKHFDQHWKVPLHLGLQTGNYVELSNENKSPPAPKKMPKHKLPNKPEPSPVLKQQDPKGNVWLDKLVGYDIRWISTIEKDVIPWANSTDESAFQTVYDDWHSSIAAEDQLLVMRVGVLGHRLMTITPRTHVLQNNGRFLPDVQKVINANS